jgi:RNA polymerase sigma factor (sigma-70 family)
MARLCRTLRGFEYDPSRGRFRTYLHRAVRNEISDQFLRPKTPGRTVNQADDAAELAVDPGDDADAHWEREWENHHLRLAMVAVRSTFDASSVAVFERLLAGDPVESVAAAFDTSTQAVHKIKQRIRNRMHDLIARQIAEEDDPDRCHD